MLTVVTVVVVFSIVILVHELGHFISARRIGVKVERFSLGFGKVLWSMKKGDTEYAISIVPFGGYVKMAGEEPSDKHEGKPYEFYAKPPGKRFWVLFSGAAVNYLLALILFSFIVPTSRVGFVLEDMPAHKAGLQPGDRIVSINGQETKYWYNIQKTVSGDVDGSPLRLSIEREGKFLDLLIVPDMVESKNIFGKITETAKIGISYYGDVAVLKANPIVCLKVGLRQTIDNTLLTYRFLWNIITGKMPLKGRVTGPVGIAVILGKAVKIGFTYLLYLVAHINLALAIFNLLPFPVLDGGHILFLGLEKIRRKPISLKVQEVMQYVAISLLIALMLYVTYNDIFMLKFMK